MVKSRKQEKLLLEDKFGQPNETMVRVHVDSVATVLNKRYKRIKSSTEQLAEQQRVKNRL